MAIKVLNSQGTKVTVIRPVPSTSPIFVDCAAAITAIQAGKLIGCPQSLGDISETRAVKEYKCLSSNESAKALGGISRGSMEIGLLLDPTDALGQAELKAAFKANENVIIGIELPDIDTTIGSTGASGTIYWFEAGVSAVSTGIAMDSAITYTATLEISSDVTECAAVAGTA